MSADPNIVDPDDKFYAGCTDDCPENCSADHQGES